MGVPKILIHFGSMSRKWQSDGSETYTYRALLNIEMFKYFSKFKNVNFACNSQCAIDEWSSQIEVPAERFKLIYNGLNKDMLGICDIQKQNEIREELNIPKSAFIVGSVYRFHRVKDPLLFIRIAKQVLNKIPNAYFLMVGDGDMKTDIIELAQTLGIRHRLILPGAILKDIANYYKLMDLYLMTSLTESLPNVVLEAQSFGVPVIASNVGGTSESLIDGKTGWLVESREPLDYLEKIENYYNIEDKEKYKAECGSVY